jgi:subtilase family serine protease
MYELGTYDPLDTHVFFSCYHLTPTIHTIKVDGGSTGAYSDEATIDVEQASALAPGATIDVYSGPNSNNSPIDLYAKIADDNLATVVSTSWGDCENDPSGAINAEAPLFQQMAAEGMTVVAASGDNGSSDCNGITNNSPAVDDPASQPFVTGVGGLSVNTLAPLRQNVWNNNGGAGGGGVSALWSRPWWQRGALFSKDTSQGVATAATRMVPDISLMADPSTGFIQYFTGDNSINVNCAHSSCVKWSSIGGTSIGPPILSAVIAIAVQTCSAVQLNGSNRLGFLNPTLYGDAAQLGNFVDVTSGNNDAFKQGAYDAGTGYDLASGLGSPTPALVKALCPSALDPTKSSLVATKRAAYLNGSVTLTAFVQSATGTPLANSPVTFTASASAGQALFDNEAATASGSGAIVTVNATATGVATVSVTATQPGPVTIRETVAGLTVSTVTVMFVATPLSELVPARPGLMRAGSTGTSLSVALVPYLTKVPPVRAYQLTLNNGKTWFSFTGNATKFSLRNLIPGHLYTLQLRAINANGAGSWSRPLHVVTPI